MGIFGRNPPPGSICEQMEKDPEEELARWHEENPLRTFYVTYAGADGRPINAPNPEKVEAHRFTVQQVGREAVVMFDHVTPSIANYASCAIKGYAVQPLTVPFTRVHSINMVMEVAGDGTAPTDQLD